MKRKILIGCGIIAVITVIIIGILLFLPRFEMTINGQKVSSEEYLYVMNHQIYDVTREYMNDSDVQINSEFWTKEINGKLPYEVLADATVEQLKYNRAVYENAKELGYVDEIDYEHIVKRMETENKSRADKIAKGEPVYGLAEFSIELFMEYEMDGFQKAYCADLTNEGMEITDEERQQYYEDNKDKYYTKEDDRTLDYIKINYESEGMTEEDTKELKNTLIALFKEIDEENSLASLAGQNSVLAEYLDHLDVSSGEFSALSKMNSDIIEYAYDLEKGETTQVIDEYGCLYLIQCTDRVDYDYVPIEEVKDNINKDLRESHYDALIEKRANASTVDGDMNDVYALTKKHITN